MFGKPTDHLVLRLDDYSHIVEETKIGGAECVTVAGLTSDGVVEPHAVVPAAVFTLEPSIKY